jgi:hypothetical protein
MKELHLSLSTFHLAACNLIPMQYLGMLHNLVGNYATISTKPMLHINAWNPVENYIRIPYWKKWVSTSESFLL